MRTFYPRETRMIDASAPHPEGTQYKVSVGDEDWGDGTYQSVVKVQMMYNDMVAGRMSPSYPVGTDDFERVQEAICELLSGEGCDGKDNTYRVYKKLTGEGLLEKLEEAICMAAPNNFLSYKEVSFFNDMFFRLSDDVDLFRSRNPEEAQEVIAKMKERLLSVETDDDSFPEYAIDLLENGGETGE